MRSLQQLVLQRLPGWTSLAESGRDDHRRFHPVDAAILDDPRNGLRRCRNDHQFDRFADFCNGGIGTPALHLRVF